MKILIKILWIIFIIISALGLILIFIGINTPATFDKLVNKTIYDFIGTFVGLATILLVIISILKQNIENSKSKIETHFFKMIGYHNQNVSQITVPSLNVDKDHFQNGRRAFVVYKIQIKRLLTLIKKINKKKNLELKEKEIIDIAYMIFYYGLQESWEDFIADKLERYEKSDLIIKEIIKEIEKKPNIKIGRTNQTSLSVYFRNMYNAIKFIDNNETLDQEEKEKYVKIYRAQLSNPELYVIFFNIASRFGKKWKKREFIEKYEFLKNIPKDYCDGYSPDKYFPMKYEHEEY